VEGIQNFKIIFAGPFGAGKTTAIESISDKPPVSTNKLASDIVANYKSETTVAMDFGMLRLDDGSVLHLYGTPGQGRFDFMWEILTEGGLGLILLIDNRRDNPFGDLKYFIKAFDRFIRRTGVAIGITGTDVSESPSCNEYREELKKLGVSAPVFEVDAREKRDVTILLEALLYSLKYD
jgi:signal recognition particle receptor subunit beta